MENKEVKRISIEEKILEGLKEGKTYREIADELIITTARVSDIKIKLVNEGKITQEEIDDAKQGKREEIKRWVLELIKDRKLYYEIVKITGLSYSALMEIKQELMREGKLDPNNVEKIHSNSAVHNEQDKDGKQASRKTKSRMETRRENVSKMKTGKREVDNRIIEDQIKHCKRKMKNKESVEEDIKQLAQAITINPEVVTVENILFIAQYYANTKKTQMSIQFLQKCILASKGNPEKTAILTTAKETVFKYQQRKMLERALDSGASPAAAAKFVGTTESEARDILEKRKQKKNLQNKNNGEER